MSELLSNKPEVKKAVHDLTDFISKLPISNELAGKSIVKVGAVMTAIDTSMSKLSEEKIYTQSELEAEIASALDGFINSVTQIAADIGINAEFSDYFEWVMTEWNKQKVYKGEIHTNILTYTGIRRITLEPALGGGFKIIGVEKDPSNQRPNTPKYQYVKYIQSTTPYILKSSRHHAKHLWIEGTDMKVSFSLKELSMYIGGN